MSHPNCMPFPFGTTVSRRSDLRYGQLNAAYILLDEIRNTYWQYGYEADLLDQGFPTWRTSPGGMSGLQGKGESWTSQTRPFASPDCNKQASHFPDSQSLKYIAEPSYHRLRRYHRCNTQECLENGNFVPAGRMRDMGRRWW